MLLIIAISTFVCITLGMVGVYWLFMRPQSAATERLRRLGQTSGTASVGTTVSLTEDDAGEKFAERIAEPINRLLPVSATEAEKLQKRLMHAGFRSRNAPLIYRSIQLLSMASFPAVVGLFCAIIARPLCSALFWILAAFVLGFFAPRYILGRMVRSRQLRIRWGLADALDLMVISIEAGLGLNAAMLKVSSELNKVHVDISHEI